MKITGITRSHNNTIGNVWIRLNEVEEHIQSLYAGNCILVRISHGVPVKGQGYLPNGYSVVAEFPYVFCVSSTSALDGMGTKLSFKLDVPTALTTFEHLEEQHGTSWCLSSYDHWCFSLLVLLERKVEGDKLEWQFPRRVNGSANI